MNSLPMGGSRRGYRAVAINKQMPKQMKEDASPKGGSPRSLDGRISRRLFDASVPETSPKGRDDRTPQSEREEAVRRPIAAKASTAPQPGKKLSHFDIAHKRHKGSDSEQQKRVPYRPLELRRSQRERRKETSPTASTSTATPASEKRHVDALEPVNNWVSRTSNRRGKKVEKKAPAPVEHIEVLSDDDENGNEMDAKQNAVSPPPLGVRHSARLAASAAKPLSSVLRGLHATQRGNAGPGSSAASNHVCIYAEDLNCLETGEFLNDTVIEFYISHLLGEMRERALEEAKGFCERQGCAMAEDLLREEVFVFSTFFYKKLTSTSLQDIGSSRLDKWTKNVDIFDKKFVFVPVCANAHWSLAIIYNKQVWYEQKLVDLRITILHLDSMTCGHRTQHITRVLRQYLDHEWQRQSQIDGSIPCQINQRDLITKQFSATSTPGTRVTVPRQDNYCDCGLFVLKYLEKLLLQTPRALKIDMHNGRVMQVSSLDALDGRRVGRAFTKQWFEVAEATALRDQLRLKLCKLFAEQHPESEQAAMALKMAQESVAQVCKDLAEDLQKEPGGGPPETVKEDGRDGEVCKDLVEEIQMEPGEAPPETVKEDCRDGEVGQEKEVEEIENS